MAQDRAHLDSRQCGALLAWLIREMTQTVDLSYAEEWKFDHGIMVPLHF